MLGPLVLVFEASFSLSARVSEDWTDNTVLSMIRFNGSMEDPISASCQDKTVTGGSEVRPNPASTECGRLRLSHQTAAAERIG